MKAVYKIPVMVEMTHLDGRQPKVVDAVEALLERLEGMTIHAPRGSLLCGPVRVAEDDDELCVRLQMEPIR